MEKSVYTFLILNLLFLQPAIAQLWYPITSDLYKDNGLGGNGGGVVTALQVYQEKLYVGGAFSKAGTLPANGLEIWDGVSWDTISNGDTTIFALEGLTVYEDELYITATFDPPTPGGGDYFQIATWDGIRLAKVSGTTSSGISGNLDIMEVYNGELYAAGSYGSFGALPCCIAKWEDSLWTQVGSSGADGSIQSLAVYNGELYAGGNFFNIGGASVSNIARWDGTTWKDVGGGVNGSVPVMTVDSINNVLYVSVGGQGLFKWDGSDWTQISGGSTGDIVPGGHGLIMYHGELYSGGAGACCGVNSDGEILRWIARWNGTKWNSVGWGTNTTVETFAIYKDTLYVGGYFTVAGTDTSYYLAKWFTDTTLGVNKVEMDEYTFKIYPNPSRDSFTIKAYIPDTDKGIIRIYGIKGELVFEKQLPMGAKLLTIDVNDWAKGVYVCVLEVEGKVKGSKKMIVE